MRFKDLVGSVEIALKKQLDDSSIPRVAIAYWCGVFLNKYRYAKIEAGHSTGIHHQIFPDVAVASFTSNATNQVPGRKYLSLPANVFDFDKDRGIDYISYSQKDGVCWPMFGSVRFNRTTQNGIQRLLDEGVDGFEYPSPSNPYFYRVSDYIYLLGVENINITSVEVGLIVPWDPVRSVSLDQFIGEVEAQDFIMNGVLELGAFVLNVPFDLENDGSGIVERKTKQ